MLALASVFAQYVVVRVGADWSGSKGPRDAPGTGTCLGHCSTIQFSSTLSKGAGQKVSIRTYAL